MKKPTVKYSEGKIGRVRVVEDFLPSPDGLVARENESAYHLTDERSKAHARQTQRAPAALEVNRLRGIRCAGTVRLKKG
jgi:hypothetical protein